MKSEIGKIIKAIVHSKFRHSACERSGNYDLIFGNPPKTHNVTKRCEKCGKILINFKGSRSEWIKYCKNNKGIK